MNIKIRLTITDDRGESFMGVGLVRLLRRIEKTGSISRAAQEMGLSYVKALRILNRLESNLPEAVLVRTRGGKERGGAKLTPFAASFLAEYERLLKRVTSFAEKEFLRPANMRKHRL